MNHISSANARAFADDRRGLPGLEGTDAKVGKGDFGAGLVVSVERAV